MARSGWRSPKVSSHCGHASRASQAISRDADLMPCRLARKITLVPIIQAPTSTARVSAIAPTRRSCANDKAPRASHHSRTTPKIRPVASTMWPERGQERHQLVCLPRHHGFAIKLRRQSLCLERDSSRTNWRHCSHVSKFSTNGTANKATENLAHTILKSVEPFEEALDSSWLAVQFALALAHNLASRMSPRCSSTSGLLVRARRWRRAARLFASSPLVGPDLVGNGLNLV